MLKHSNMLLQYTINHQTEINEILGNCSVFTSNTGVKHIYKINNIDIRLYEYNILEKYNC